MKIYCILLDTMPFCSEVQEILKITGGTLARQVSGCFTNESLIQMFTGKLTSDLEPNGIGYRLTWNRFGRYQISIWSWMKEFIQFYLRDKGFNFVSRNHKEIVSTVLGFGNYPEFYTDTSVDRLDMADPSLKQLLCNNNEGKKFEQEEFDYIDKIQQPSDKNIFHLISYTHYHSAVHSDIHRQKSKQLAAGNRVLELLKHWDFSEPDALFWIFSDHGSWFNPRVDAYPHPQHFYSWVIVKDNSKNSINLVSKVIDIKDFTSYMKLKFDFIPLPEIFASKKRIYLTEDGRMAIDEEHMTTAIACCFEKWKKDFPQQMNYVIYHKPDNCFIQRKAIFDENSFITKVETLSNVIDDSLVNALIQKFDWISK